MKLRQIVYFLCAVFVLIEPQNYAVANTSKKKAVDLPLWMTDAKELFKEWAFADSSGSKLLSLTNLPVGSDLKKDLSLRQFMSGVTKAFCSNGLIKIKFIKYQTSTEDFNGRDTSNQFEKRAGFVFSILEKKVPDDSVCMLLSPQLEKELTNIKLPIWRSISPSGSFSPEKTAKKSLLQKIASKVGRAVDNASAIATFGKNTLWAVNFKRQGDKKYAGFFLDPQVAWLDAYSVDCKPEYCDSFRVDGEDGIKAAEFEFLGAAKWRGHSFFFMLWNGIEGQSINVYAIEGKHIYDLYFGTSLGYRYWSPP